MEWRLEVALVLAVSFEMVRDARCRDPRSEFSLV